MGNEMRCVRQQGVRLLVACCRAVVVLELSFGELEKM